MKICLNLTPRVRNLCFDENALTRLQAYGTVVYPETLSKEWVIENARDAEVMITGWESIAVDADVVQAAPKLKLVLHSAGSIRGIESPELWQRGIRVTSSANINGVPVAEFLLGLILTSFKGVFEYSRRFREQGRAGWERSLTHPLPGYYHSVVGIIGMGNVGKHLLKLLAPFDFNVLIHSFYPFEKQAAEAGVELVEIDEIMRRSDAVVVAAPNLEEFRKMFDARRFALMKDGAWFLNAARGALVDEEALITELQSGRINAALDVTYPEPPLENSPFYTLPNCILTPHIAGSMDNECLRLGDQVVKELAHYIQGEAFENEITEELSRIIG